MCFLVCLFTRDSRVYQQKVRKKVVDIFAGLGKMVTFASAFEGNAAVRERVSE